MSEPARTWTLMCHVFGRPLTMNAVRRMHHHAYASHVRDTRALWALYALRAKIPPLDAARIVVTPLHKDRRTPQDVAACAPEAKAAVDGLVDAGVLADDSPEFLLAVEFRPPRVCGVDGLELVVEEVA